MKDENFKTNIRWTLDNEGSKEIRYAEILPKKDTLENVSNWIVFLNGRSEWIEKYTYICSDLRLPATTAFLFMDHRGQGASAGTRGHIDTYASYAVDLEKIIKTVIAEKPYSIVAHSMGCLISAYAIANQMLKPQKVVFLSPFFGVPNDPVPTVVSRPLAKTLCSFNLGFKRAVGGNFEKPPFPGNKLTHDPVRYQTAKESSYKLPAPTFAWIHASFEAQDFVFTPEALKNFSCPVLVLAGSDERCVNPKGIDQWVQAAATVHPQLIFYTRIQNSRHELLSELPGPYNEALHYIRNFLK